MIAQPPTRTGPLTTSPLNPHTSTPFTSASVESPVGLAVEALRGGRMVIVTNGSGGMLALASGHVTGDAINVMARLARGLVCVTMTGERLDALGIPQAPATEGALRFAVSVEAREGVTSGISAEDRARTVRVLIDPGSQPGDLLMPGHTFPIRSEDGGVLRHPGHAEALTDLCRLAELAPSAVLCGVLDGSGATAGPRYLQRLGHLLGAPLVSIDDVVRHRIENERLIERVTSTGLPCTGGPWRVIAYRSSLDDAEYLALVLGDVDSSAPVEVAVQSHDLISEVLATVTSPLQRARRRMERDGRGVIIYILPRGPRAHCAAGSGLPGVIQQQILADIGVTSPFSGEEA